MASAQTVRDTSNISELERAQVIDIRANNKTPVAFTNISKTHIQKMNFGLDMPFLLNFTPSALATSDTGTGIGYTGLRVRGTDATRINVTSNGIPMNDVESSMLYWVNIGDFASNVQNVQLQRGVGTSTNGAGAFGATLNMQTNAPGGAMRVTLDGNKAVYYTVKDYATCSDGGRSVEVAMPLTGLTMGRHTLTFTAQDMSGKPATQTIHFVVASASDVALMVEERPASTQATFTLASNSLTTIPAVTLRVTDCSGRTVWNTSASSFPITWDLRDNNGQRVPAGVYKFFATYTAGNAYGGTDISELVVIDPLTAQLP